MHVDIVRIKRIHDVQFGFGMPPNWPMLLLWHQRPSANKLSMSNTFNPLKAVDIVNPKPKTYNEHNTRMISKSIVMEHYGMIMPVWTNKLCF